TTAGASSTSYALGSGSTVFTGDGTTTIAGVTTSPLVVNDETDGIGGCSGAAEVGGNKKLLPKLTCSGDVDLKNSDGATKMLIPLKDGPDDTLVLPAQNQQNQTGIISTTSRSGEQQAGLTQNVNQQKDNEDAQSQNNLPPEGSISSSNRSGSHATSSKNSKQLKPALLNMRAAFQWLDVGFQAAPGAGAQDIAGGNKAGATSNNNFDLQSRSGASSEQVGGTNENNSSNVDALTSSDKTSNDLTSGSRMEAAGGPGAPSSVCSDDLFISNQSTSSRGLTGTNKVSGTYGDLDSCENMSSISSSYARSSDFGTDAATSRGAGPRGKNKDQPSPNNYGDHRVGHLQGSGAGLSFLYPPSSAFPSPSRAFSPQLMLQNLPRNLTREDLRRLVRYFNLCRVEK
ncbi:unnamed protein product, partial [Amoebophrya sp. A120]